MKHFAYKNHNLFIEDVAVKDIAAKVGTPFYCYSKSTLLENFQNYSEAFADTSHKICYAVKANSNLNILKILASLGAGADVLSMGEIWRCLKAGIDAKKIVFAGVGKSKEEMEFALQNGVEEFSIESEPELFLLSEIATKLGKTAKIAVRVNPDVDAKSHQKISTGRKGDKFGIDIDKAPEIYRKAKNLSGIKIFGISTHIGSQITSISPFKTAFLKIRELCLSLRAEGFNIENLDLGGGVGILYNDETPIIISQYAQMVKEIIFDLNISITLAPGRSIVGNAGIMVSKVLYIKETTAKNFVIIDAAMNDLMRPGLYDSYHKVIPVFEKKGVEGKFDIAGPVCESTDILGKNRDLINPQSEELLAFLSCGAYGSSMSNEYNSRPLIPEVLVDGNNFKIIRRRPSYEEMTALEDN